MSFYSIQNDVVAFICNRASIGAVYPDDWYIQDLKRISDSCGRYIAGATQTGNDDQALVLGYARWKKGDDFCADATSSPSSSC